MEKKWKKYLKQIGYLCFLIAAVVLLLEIAFRYQVIEFYSAELRGLNPELKNIHTASDSTILVIGDSFSAHPDGYVSHLKNSFSQYQFVNASVPGTGILQQELYFQKRVNQFRPHHILYQFYVGNDLLDLERPVNYKTLPFLRNVYWGLSTKIRILQYLNYRMASVTSPNKSIGQLQEPEFTLEKYNSRVKMQFAGDSSCLASTVLQKGKYEQVYGAWKERFLRITNSLPDGVTVSMVMIPHCAQVNAKYGKRMRLMGGEIPDNLTDVEYALVQQVRKDFKKVRVLNPLGYFQKKEREGATLYYHNDPHLSPEGHKQLGEFLKANLHVEND